MSASKKKLERQEAQQTDSTLTEKQKRELKDAKVKRRNTILATVAGVIAVILVIALLVWRSGVIPRHTAALTVHGTSYSVVDMDYYYYQAINSTYSYEQQMANLYQQLGMSYTPSFDPSQDLRTQFVPDENGKPTEQNLHDYFLEAAKASAVRTAARYDAAKAAGYALSEDAKAELDKSMNDLRATALQRYPSVTAFLQAAYGPNMTEGVYRKNLERDYLAQDYYSSVANAMGNYSDAELTAYFDENPGLLSSYTYDMVLLTASMPAATTDDAGNTVQPTDEEKAAAMAEAKTRAEALMADIRAAEAEHAAGTNADADVAGEHNVFQEAASGYSLNATRQTNILGSNISAAAYGEWLIDASRQAGDMELFEVPNNGYYVVQYVSRVRDDNPTVDVRHILLSTAVEDDPDTPDVDESKQEPTEARIAEVKAQAQDILDEYLAGEQTAEAFGKLAEEYSEDGRTSEGALSRAGGLYSGVEVGDMVTEFNDWIFDPSRQVGDTGLVQTRFGWHVMYFQATQPPVWKTQAETGKKSADQLAFQNSLEEGYEAVETAAFAQVANR